MNYWPAEITNLAEMHEPFLQFIDEMRPDARKTAKEVYGCDGIVAHYTTDVWHFTEPTGKQDGDCGRWELPGVASICGSIIFLMRTNSICGILRIQS